MPFWRDDLFVQPPLLSTPRPAHIKLSKDNKISADYEEGSYEIVPDMVMHTAYRDYKKLRKMGDLVSRRMLGNRDTILAYRRKRIECFERTFPELRPAYEQEEGD